MVNYRHVRERRGGVSASLPPRAGGNAVILGIVAMMSEAAEHIDTQFGERGAEQEIERLLLASAGAIQRLVAQRDALRARVEGQERELIRLRHHVTLFHDSYRRLTTEFVTQFQLIDSAVASFVRGPMAHPDTPKVEPEQGADG
jgi:hypothetical protein